MAHKHFSLLTPRVTLAGLIVPPAKLPLILTLYSLLSLFPLVQARILQLFMIPLFVLISLVFIPKSRQKASVLQRGCCSTAHLADQWQLEVRRWLTRFLRLPRKGVQRWLPMCFRLLIPRPELRSLARSLRFEEVALTIAFLKFLGGLGFVECLLYF